MESIDYDRLRSDLISFFEGAYFVAGFGSAIIERNEVEEASNEELVQIALRKGFHIQDYIVDEKGYFRRR